MKRLGNGGFMAPRGAPTMLFGIILMGWAVFGIFPETGGNFKGILIGIGIGLFGLLLTWLGVTGRGY